MKGGGFYLSQLEKLLDRIRNNPKTVRFEELNKILIKNGFTRRQPHSGSSHYIYTKQGVYPISVPYNSPYVKEKYVELALEAIGDYCDE